jgi:hypothetical protein
MSLHGVYRLSIALALLACCAQSRGAEPAPIAIPASGKSVESFVPRDYRIHERHEADLNGDGLRDAVLVLEFDDDVLAYENPRPLVILFRQRDGGYRLSARSDDVVYTASPGAHGDHFYGIEIRGRTVIVKDGGFSGGGAEGGDQHQKFRYQNGGWYLIGVDDHEWRYPRDGNVAADASRNNAEWCPWLKLPADQTCMELRVSKNFNTREETVRWDIYPVANPFDTGDDPIRTHEVRRKLPPKPLVPFADLARPR